MIEFRFVKATDELETALKIRRKVFIEEAGVSENIEIDDFDTLRTDCQHILVFYKGAPIGTARCRLLSESVLKIQRFCFYKEYRHQGFGKALLEFIENEFTKKGFSNFFLEAKFSVHPFYEKCGYKKQGDVFEEANVPHIRMEKSF